MYRDDPRNILIKELQKSQELFIKLAQTLEDDTSVKKSISEIEDLIYFIKIVDIHDIEDLLKSFLNNEDSNEDVLKHIKDFKKNHFDKFQVEDVNEDTLFNKFKKGIEQYINKETVLSIFYKNTISLNQDNIIDGKNTYLLDAIQIKNYFSIENIDIQNLKDKKEVYFVGENGDGKTILLQAITIALKGVKEGDVFDLVKGQNSYEFVVLDSEGKKYTSKEEVYRNLFAYGASRNNYCQLKEDSTGYLTLFSGEYDLKSPKKWLIDLYNAQNAKEKTIISLDDAITLLQYLLNKDIDLEVTYKNVMFKEKGSEVSFDQLSSGYKGVITIICDLIARFAEKQQVEKIADFQGVVLIDEVELHLHPKWQYSFMKKLTDTFPLIQFMVTTHSPTVLLGASEDAVFYKVYKEDGKTKISQPMDSIKNLMANSLSTSPLFDMDTARARDNDNKLDTREDFISSKIHNIIKERTKGKKAIVEEEIIDMINQELDDYLKENNL